MLILAVAPYINTQMYLYVSKLTTGTFVYLCAPLVVYNYLIDISLTRGYTGVVNVRMEAV
jgi:hypothetical protein